MNTAEAINSAGGTIIGDDGKPTIPTREAKKGMENLVTTYADGNIPKEGITFQEEQGRQAGARLLKAASCCSCATPVGRHWPRQ